MRTDVGEIMALTKKKTAMFPEMPTAGVTFAKLKRETCIEILEKKRPPLGVKG